MKTPIRVVRPQKGQFSTSLRLQLINSADGSVIREATLADGMSEGMLIEDGQHVTISKETREPR